MSPLTAALSGVSTERIAHPDETLENLLSRCGSMASLRAANEEDRTGLSNGITVEEATNVCLESVIGDLRSIFSRTQYDSKFFLVEEKATSEEISGLESVLKEFYPGYDKGKCTWADFRKLGGTSEMFYKLLQCPLHCRRNKYSFQFKKCGNPLGCEFKFCKPVRMDKAQFLRLQFIAMPSPDPERTDEFLPFEKAFEKTDTHCPSVSTNSKPITEPLKVNFTTASHRDDLPSLLINKKARAWIFCTLCAKPRLLYSDTPLNTHSLSLLKDLEEGSKYVCGDEFIPEGHILHRAWAHASAADELSSSVACDSEGIVEDEVI
jgi:hypothetical protein